MRGHLLVLPSMVIGCAAAPAASTTPRPAAAAPAGEPKRADESPAARPDPVREQEPEEPPPLPEGTVVLHVGSSSAGSLGKNLNEELEKRGIRSILKQKEATYIPQWAGPTMGLPQLVATHDPDLVIVNVGGNEMSMPDPSVRAEAIQRLVKTIGDRPCLWIGTPIWKGVPHTGILDVIRENCAPCRYVDTNALVPDLKPAGDGIHPTIPERRRWAKRMIRWMQHNRDPHGKRPWDFKEDLALPPPEK